MSGELERIIIEMRGEIEKLREERDEIIDMRDAAEMHVIRLRILGRDGQLITQGAFNALMSQLDKMHEENAKLREATVSLASLAYRNGWDLSPIYKKYPWLA